MPPCAASEKLNVVPGPEASVCLYELKLVVLFTQQEYVQVRLSPADPKVLLKVGLSAGLKRRELVTSTLPPIVTGKQEPPV